MLNKKYRMYAMSIIELAKHQKTMLNTKTHISHLCVRGKSQISERFNYCEWLLLGAELGGCDIKMIYFNFYIEASIFQIFVMPILFLQLGMRMGN